MTTELITPDDLDLAAIMAGHVVAPRGLHNCRLCLSRWPCVPYRLAAALADRDAKIAAVRAICRSEIEHQGTAIWNAVSAQAILAALDEEPAS